MMKKTIIHSFYIFFFVSIVYANKGNVYTGIDVLKENGFAELKGKNVGLITNHTGVDRFGTSTIDILFSEKDVKLVKLFSPEHGLRGTFDEKVEDETDPVTGLPVISLYGKDKRKPKIKDIKDLDVLVFDIQDIGCRFYTYISTMAKCMEAAKEAGIPIIVLDRPNPIGGKIVSGFVPHDTLTGGFTAIYPMPTRHGMTVGELAGMFNKHHAIKADLKVIVMKGWQREMFWDETGLSWINPSPNMKSLTGALCYPGLGWLETTRLSMGRGTDIPFEVYGAPYIDKHDLYEKVKKHELKGARVIPTTFIPSASQHKYYNEKCQGIKLVIYDKTDFDAFEYGLNFYRELTQLYPEEYTQRNQMRISLGDDNAGEYLKKTGDLSELISGNKEKMEKFMEIRSKYLLY